jgi:hypothetical protein
MRKGRLKRFPAKACPALDAGWIPVRVKKTCQIKEAELPFRFNRNGKGSEPLATPTTGRLIGAAFYVSGERAIDE